MTDYRMTAEPVRCRICGGWFSGYGYRCAVAHPPGTCCHYGTRPVDVACGQCELPGYLGGIARGCGWGSRHRWKIVAAGAVVGP